MAKRLQHPNKLQPKLGRESGATIGMNFKGSGDDLLQDSF